MSYGKSWTGGGRERQGRDRALANRKSVPAKKRRRSWHENEAAPAPAADDEPSDVGYAVDRLTEAADGIIDRLERLECENVFLRGQFDALAQIVGQKLGNSTTVLKPESDPKKRKRRRNNDAAT